MSLRAWGRVFAVSTRRLRSIKQTGRVTSLSTPTPPPPMSATADALALVIDGDSHSHSSKGKQLPSLGEIVNGLLVVQHPMTPASMLKRWLPLLSAADRVTVTQVVCADASVRGARVHLHCLRGAFALDLTTRELQLHADSVGRRWLAGGAQMRAHVEALVVLLLRSSLPDLRARALACLGPAVLGYELAHEESFTNVLYNLFQFTHVPLDRAHRAALTGLLKALPRRATIYWPDDNWSVAVHILALNNEFEPMIELLDIWFDRALPTTRFKEIHFVGVLAVLARALRRDLAELVVQQYMIQMGKIELTSLTYGVMIQVRLSRDVELIGARAHPLLNVGLWSLSRNRRRSSLVRRRTQIAQAIGSVLYPDD
jgi:hypothetical protein